MAEAATKPPCGDARRGAEALIAVSAWLSLKAACRSWEVKFEVIDGILFRARLTTLRGDVLKIWALEQGFGFALNDGRLDDVSPDDLLPAVLAIARR